MRQQAKGPSVTHDMVKDQNKYVLVWTDPEQLCAQQRSLVKVKWLMYLFANNLFRRPAGAS